MRCPMCGSTKLYIHEKLVGITDGVIETPMELYDCEECAFFFAAPIKIE